VIGTAASSPYLRIAIDLGSARTLVHCRDRGLWVDEPTVVARDFAERIVATGRQALDPQLRSASSRVHRPVRRGLVFDPIDCVHLLRGILERSGLAAPSFVQLSTPAGASSFDVSLMSAAVFSATGCYQQVVPSLLAGAVGVGLNTKRPTLICDMGAELFEVGAIVNGHLIAQSAAAIEGRETPIAALNALDTVLRRVTGPRVDFDNQPLHLIGGAASAGLAAALSAHSGRPVQAHDDEGFAVAAGLQRVPRSLGGRHGVGRGDLTRPSARHHPIVAKRRDAARPRGGAA
jgi:hypothetical protein